MDVSATQALIAWYLYNAEVWRRASGHTGHGSANRRVNVGILDTDIFQWVSNKAIEVHMADMTPLTTSNHSFRDSSSFRSSTEKSFLGERFDPILKRHLC